MTQCTVRIDQRNAEGDRNPHGIAITEERTWTLPGTPSVEDPGQGE